MGMLPPPAIPGSSAAARQPWPKRSLTGPRVFCPGDNLVKAPDIPEFLKNLPANPGHPDAHSSYDKMRDWFARRAFAPHVELILVKVSMMYMKIGNKKPVTVGVCDQLFMWISLIRILYKNVTETIDSVPVHVGAYQLKYVCYLTVLHKFLEWSRGVPLDISEIRLRNKLWVLIEPLNGIEDVDAVSKKFFEPRGKNKLTVFHAGTGVDLCIEISSEKYDKAFARREAVDNPKPISAHRNRQTNVYTAVNELEDDNDPDEETLTAKGPGCVSRKRHLSVGAHCGRSSYGLITATENEHQVSTAEKATCTQ
jgi:hypothetical protein